MLRNYLLTAYKVFMRRKLFTAINLLCIVLTLVILMVVTALLENTFEPQGVEGRSARFLQVAMMHSEGKNGHHRRDGTLGYKVIDKYLRHLPNVEAVAAVSVPETVAVYQGDRVTGLLIRHADADYWKILDFTVLAGRLPSADDVAQGRMVAVINASTARKLYGDAPAVGQPLSAGGQTFQVIGVVEDVLHVNAMADIWVPVTTTLNSEYRSQMFGLYTAILMVHDPAQLPALKLAVEQAARGVQYDDPKAWDQTRFWADSKLDLFARVLFNSTGSDGGGTRLLLIISVLMLLFMLLPALNLVNLNTGRILERSSEIGVRKAFGATSMQLVWQLVLENVLLCIAGGAFGLLCATAVLYWLGASGLIPYLKVQLDFAVFGYGLLLTLVFGLLSGVVPAWKMSRLDPVHALKGAA